MARFSPEPAGERYWIGIFGAQAASGGRLDARS
jgi:hypothetical protein